MSGHCGSIAYRPPIYLWIENPPMDTDDLKSRIQKHQCDEEIKNANAGEPEAENVEKNTHLSSTR